MSRITHRLAASAAFAGRRIARVRAVCASPEAAEAFFGDIALRPEPERPRDLLGWVVTRDADPDAGVTTTLRLSLLRAPRFPDPETDQGEQTHRYGLVIGSTVADATEAGLALNFEPRERTGSPVAPLVRASEGILVAGVKLAADRSGDLIVRVYEPNGRRTTGEIAIDAPVAAIREASLIEDPGAELPAGPLSVTLTPFEVRTYRIALA